jgi:4-hydroxythreonine-4-phosphate dehydrogenase
MKSCIPIVVTMGDPAGIGPEITAKALKKAGRTQRAAFFVCGDSYVLSRYGFKSDENVSLIDLKNITPKGFRPGHPTGETSVASYDYLRVAAALLKRGFGSALVTAPISKEHIAAAGFPWPGHTEFLGDCVGVKNMEMVFVSKKIKVVLVTRHLALKRAIASLSKERIVACGRNVLKLLKESFKIKDPRILVSGLNPHAGESGLFGREEIRIVAPAISELNRKNKGTFVGPIAPDAVFRRFFSEKFDMVMALYHDQGLIPFKLYSFWDGVQLTAGLPFVRTSPAHGTAYAIAGKGRADHRPMLEAINLACSLSENVLR